MTVIRSARPAVRHECPDPSVDYGFASPEVGDVYRCDTCLQMWVWRWRKVSGSTFESWRPMRWWDREARALVRELRKPSAQPVTITASSATAEELADGPDDDD